MVVVAKPPRRQLPRGARRGRHRQHLAAEAEAQVADPAAAEGGKGGIRKPRPLRGVLSAAARSAAGPGVRSAGRVENICQGLGRAAHQRRLRADHVAAISPGPDEGDLVRIRPHQPQNVHRSQVPA